MNTKTVLFTGGRAPVTLDLARYFSHFGHRVLIAESLPQNVSRSSSCVSANFTIRAPNPDPEGFIEDLKEIIAFEKVDVLIPTCEEVFHVSKGKQELEKHCRVLVDNRETLGILHDKWKFNQLAHELGAAPRSSIAASAEELRRLSSERPIVIKPVFSRFASNAFVLREGDALPEVEVSAAHPWIVQQFIPGREICTYSVCEKGKLLAHVTYSHEFTAGKGAGICFEAIEQPKVLEWIRKVAAKTAFTGQIAFDFIETDSGEIHPLECNPRATSGAHLFSHEDRLDLVLTGDKKDLVIPAAGRMGMIGLAMFVYGLPSVRGMRRLREWFRVLFHARDVSFSWRDPFPFFYQFVCLFELWLSSRRDHVTILEASTRDIEWNGGR